MYKILEKQEVFMFILSISVKILEKMSDQTDITTVYTKCAQFNMVIIKASKF